MKKKQLVMFSSGLALVFLTSATPSSSPTNTQTAQQISEWLIVGAPSSTFTPGQSSLSIGLAQASGNGSLAIGNAYNAASGYNSIAHGYNSVASGANSIAMGGYSAVASGLSSIALGNQAFATGQNSMALGYGSTASARSSMAMGNFSHASGGYSIAMGWNSRVLGNYSIAMGRRCLAYGEVTYVIGRNNDPGAAQTGAKDSLNLENHLFVVGNGPDHRSRSNALVTKHSGETTLINRNWDASNPTASTADDGHGNTGEALIVDGHTVLNGKVIISQVQGDISMGIFGE